MSAKDAQVDQPSAAEPIPVGADTVGEERAAAPESAAVSAATLTATIRKVLGGGPRDSHETTCLRHPMHWPDEDDGKPGYERIIGGPDAECSCGNTAALAALSVLEQQHADAERLERLNTELTRDYNAMLIEQSKQRTRAEAAEAALQIVTDQPPTTEQLEQDITLARANIKQWWTTAEQDYAPNPPWLQAFDRVAEQARRAAAADNLANALREIGADESGIYANVRLIARDALAAYAAATTQTKDGT